MSPYQNWLIEQHEHLLTLTLNRAHKLNTLTPAALHELRQIAQQIRADRSVWCVLLQGAGEHFSAGVDVSQIAQLVRQDQETFRAHLRDLQDCIDQFEAIPQPTIARISGHCVGGGLILACACDFRVADTTARFYVPEVRLGIAVIMGTQRLTRLAGIPATKEMILLAEPFDAAQAQAWNLLHRVAPPETLDQTVQHITERLLQLPPRTLTIAKEIIDRGATLSLRDSQELEIDLQAGLLDSPDFAEGVQAFFEKRTPQFRGE